MLTQDQVDEYACRFLTDTGWTVVSRRKARRPGIDTVVIKDGRRLIVAPRGAGSSQPGTNRYGSDFTRSQVYDHVANALARMLRQVVPTGSLGAFAAPYNEHYREAIGSLHAALVKVDIGVLWVSADGTVNPDTPWAL